MTLLEVLGEGIGVFSVRGCVVIATKTPGGGSASGSCYLLELSLFMYIEISKMKQEEVSVGKEEGRLW